MTNLQRKADVKTEQGNSKQMYHKRSSWILEILVLSRDFSYNCRFIMQKSCLKLLKLWIQSNYGSKDGKGKKLYFYSQRNSWSIIYDYISGNLDTWLELQNWGTLLGLNID